MLVTGANGFLGREIVARAVQGGHEIVAVVRPGARIEPQLASAAVAVLEADLRTRGALGAALDGAVLDGVGSNGVASKRVDVVVHAAAAAGGSRAVQLSNTVVATERLLDALDRAPPKRLVLVSSFSVYDYHALGVGGALDEDARLERRPHERDPYTEAKLVQETMVRRWCESRCVPCTIVRPGAIVGPGRDWDHGAALSIGRLAFVVAPHARFRLVAVADCADAIVRAAELASDGIETVNIVDDDPPTHADFFRRCRRAGATAQILVPVPWLLLDAVGRTLDIVSRRLFGGRLRRPELLDHRRQEARWKPLRYPISRAQHVLGWSPVEPLDDTIRSAVVSGRSLGRA